MAKKRKAKRVRTAPKKKRPPARRKAQTGPPVGAPDVDGRWVVERRTVAGVLVQLQWVRCHKKCWCMRTPEPPWHGPYWYAYVANRRGAIAARYVGVDLSKAKVLAVAG